VILVAGPDARNFLQGLLTNDVTKVGPESGVYAALLTPQGRVLHDMFLVAAPSPAGSDSAEPGGEPAGVWLDVEAARRDDLLARLARYRLRARVALEDLTDSHEVLALTGGAGVLELTGGAGAALGLSGTPGAARPVAGGGVAVVDPRLGALGVRLVVPRAARSRVLEATGAVVGAAESADRRRLALGVPDGSRDLEPERALPLENNLDALNAISWTKGCYVGQELTARMRYRGLVRRRLRPVQVDGPLPEPGTPILRGDQEVGELRSGRDGLALALLRLEVLAQLRPEALALPRPEALTEPAEPPLRAGDAILTVLDSGWGVP
jgi:hypothetical protein